MRYAVSRLLCKYQVKVEYQIFMSHTHKVTISQYCPSSTKIHSCLSLLIGMNRTEARVPWNGKAEERKSS